MLDRQSLELRARYHLPCNEVYDLVLVQEDLLEGIRRGFHINPKRALESDQFARFRAAGIEPARLWAVGDRLEPKSCRARITARDMPNELSAAAKILVRCEVENLGNAIFVSAPPHPVHLSYRWVMFGKVSLSPIEGDRTLLPHSLAPLQKADCIIEVTAPSGAGDYALTLSLVQEDVAWFCDLHPDLTTFSSVRIIAATS
jgi:hypothetical protein